eukprot:91684_1
MWGMGMYGSRWDIEEDNDDMLIMSVSSLHQASLPRPKMGMKGADESWLSNNIHKDCVRICNKYNDKKWLGRGQHEYCIYYCCHMLGSLCNLGEEACIKVLDEPNCVETLLALWKGDKTWFESRCAARTISNIFAHSSLCLHRFRKNKRSINVAELAIKQYTECVRYVIRNCTVAPEAAMKGYVTDLVVKIKDKTMQYEDHIVRSCSIKSAQDWMRYNGSILCCIGRSLNDDIFNLFQMIDIAVWEKAVAMDLCYRWFHGADVGDPDTFMDALVPLTAHKTYAKLISSSEFIIKSLILVLRSRSAMRLRYDLIVLNLLKLNVFPRKYYYDLCVSLVLLLDVDRKYDHTKLYVQHGNTFISESVIQCIQLLFDIPIEITCLQSRKIINKFKCTSCHKWLNNPHKTACKHRYCYLCIAQIKVDDDHAKCIVNTCKNRKFKFTHKTEKFDFKSWNGMNKLRVKMTINDGQDTFVGEWNALWLFIKDNLNRNKLIHPLNLTHEFEYFCDFMIKESYVRTVQELKELRLKARNKRLEGNGYFKTNQYDEAIAAYRDALHLCPNKYADDRVTYYSNLGLSYLKSNLFVNAYKTALSGLALNPYHLKLSNILSKCYTKMNVSELFTASIIDDRFDTFNDDLYLNKVHNVMMFDFYVKFNYAYWAKLCKDKEDEMKNISNREADVMIEKRIKEDPIAGHLDQKKKEYIERKIHFVNLHMGSYLDKYDEFLIQKQRAKKEAYQFLMYILAHKEEFWIYEEGELEEEEFVQIRDLLEVIEEHFCLETLLDNLDKMEQETLVSGYTIHRIPAVIKSLIQKHIFEKPKYNYYKCTPRIITRMVRKSEYLTLSDKSLVENEYSQKYRGVKLTDSDRSVDCDWREIEFSDCDSGIDEFCSHVDD